jgi:hypothetical protein
LGGTREVFEKWAKSLPNYMDITRFEAGYSDCNTDYAWAGWQAAQPVQEPVAWLYKGDAEFDGKEWRDNIRVTTSKQVADWQGKDIQPLYTTPPQRKALTDEQIEKCIEAVDSKWADAFVAVEWARHLTKAIEAAHGIGEQA